MDFFTGYWWLDLLMVVTGLAGGGLVLFGRWAKRRWLSAAGIGLAWAGLGPAILMATGVVEPGIYWRRASTTQLIGLVDGSMSMSEERALALLSGRIAAGRVDEAEFAALLAQIEWSMNMTSSNQTPAGLYAVTQLLDAGTLPERLRGPFVDWLIETTVGRRANTLTTANGGTVGGNSSVRVISRSGRVSSYSPEESRLGQLAVDPATSKEHRDRIVEMMFKSLEDTTPPPQPWVGALRELVSDGRLDRAGIDRFFTAMTRVELAAAPAGAADETGASAPKPMTFTPGDVVAVRALGVIDEQTMPYSPVMPWRGEVKLRMGKLESIGGSISLPVWRESVGTRRGGRAMSQDDQPLAYVKLPMEPGEYELVADVTVELTKEMRREALAMNPRYRKPGMNIAKLPEVHLSRTVSVKVKVAGEPAAPPERIDGEESRAAVRKSLRTSRIAPVSPVDGGFSISVPMAAEDPPAALSMLAFWRVGGKEYPIGRLLVMQDGARPFSLQGLVQDGDGQSYVVLRADPDFLRHATGVKKVYDGPEIEMEVNAYLR